MPVWKHGLATQTMCRPAFLCLLCLLQAQQELLVKCKELLTIQDKGSSSNVAKVEAAEAAAGLQAQDTAAAADNARALEGTLPGDVTSDVDPTVWRV
jgi:hypothetical protein